MSRHNYLYYTMSKLNRDASALLARVISANYPKAFKFGDIYLRYLLKVDISTIDVGEQPFFKVSAHFGENISYDDALEMYKANRTLENAIRVRNAYINKKYCESFNAYKEHEVSTKVAEYKKNNTKQKYNFSHIYDIIKKATKVGRYKVTDTSIGRYSKAALAKAACNMRNNGAKYSNTAYFVIEACIKYIDNELSKETELNYYA